jgi:hypothetical protein
MPASLPSSLDKMVLRPSGVGDQGSGGEVRRRTLRPPGGISRAGIGNPGRRERLTRAAPTNPPEVA